MTESPPCRPSSFLPKSCPPAPSSVSQLASSCCWCSCSCAWQTTVLDPADTLGLEEALKKHQVLIVTPGAEVNEVLGSGSGLKSWPEGLTSGCGLRFS